METTRSEELMTAQELAVHLGVKPGTILGWHRQGKIPARRLSHKVLRFNLRETLAALEAAKPRQDTARQGGDGMSGKRAKKLLEDKWDRESRVQEQLRQRAVFWEPTKDSHVGRTSMHAVE